MNNSTNNQSFDYYTCSTEELIWAIDYGKKKISIAKSELIHGEITNSDYANVLATYEMERVKCQSALDLRAN